MKTPSEDHDLIRFLDGEMNDAERASFEARMAADPMLKSEVQMMQRMSADLRTHLPAEMPVPYADFFNSQIQVRIAQEEPIALPSTRASWLDWLRIPTLMTAAAAVAIGGFMIAQKQTAPVSGNSVVHSIYVPNPAVQARSYHSEEAQATVLILEGVEAMPADRKIVGFNIQRTETDQEVATTTLFGESGQVVAVMAKDARNQPRLLSATPPRG
jgi:anti-sigma-K factor RskA